MMYLDPRLPDFPIFKMGEKGIMAKFRIVGILRRENDKIYLSPPQSRFFDTSKPKDPTCGALNTVQFQTDGLNLDELYELKDLEVRVETGNGAEVEHFLEFEGEGALEYGSEFPLKVTVKNWLLNKQTTFIASAEKAPHDSLPNEVVFRFKVEKKEERLEVLADHPKFEAPITKPTNGDGRDHRKQSEDPDKSKKRKSKAKEEPLPNLTGMSSKDAVEVSSIN